MPCIHPTTATVTFHGDEEDDRAVNPDNVIVWAQQVWDDRWEVQVHCEDCVAIPKIIGWEEHPDADTPDPDGYWDGMVLTLDWGQRMPEPGKAVIIT